MEVNNMKKYAVIVSEIDTDMCAPESEVYLFDTYEQAYEYFKSIWEYYYDLAVKDKRCNGGFCWKDYAQLKWGCDKRTFEVVSVTEPIKFD
jgi:hypothetical protein|nr:MAG TPA: hypothetical protein [Caudoviricetes sp.]